LLRTFTRNHYTFAVVQSIISYNPAEMIIKRILPYIAAVALFVIITLAQFNPLFSGKAIKQYDISQHQGSSKEIVDFRKTYHEEPLWTNSMFGGMPAYQISTAYPGNWMSFIDKLIHLFMPHQAGYMFMYFLGFFILLLCLRIDPWLALVGSLAYGFSSYFYIIIEVGHNSKADAIGYLAPSLGGLVLLMQRKYLAGLSLTALFMALELNANHLQITYYGMILFGFVFLAYFIADLRAKQLKHFFIGLGVFGGAMVLAILPNAGSLLCTYEYGQYSTRGKTELSIDATGKPNTVNVTSGLDKAYALDYSSGISETFAFLIPNFKGGQSTARISSHPDALEKVEPQMREMTGQFGSYFGPQDFTAGPVYIGAIIILLAFLALFVVDHTLKWPLVATTVLAVILAWGKFFPGPSSFFLDYFPAYNKFRSVSIINILAEITLPLLAVLALDKLIKARNTLSEVSLFGKKYTLKQILMVSVIVVGGFCLLCILTPGMVNTFTGSKEEAQIGAQLKQAGYPEQDVNQVLPSLMTNLSIARTAIFTSDAMRSLIFILIAAAALFLFIFKKLNVSILLPLLGVLILADLWPVAARYLNKDSFVRRSEIAVQQASPADEQILADKTLNYRVINIAASPFQDATTSYYHQSIGGYHGAKLKKYHELMEFHLFNEIQIFNKGVSEAYGNDSLMKNLFLRLPVLNMLNTKYFIVPTRQDQVVITNNEHFGNAWFVKSLKVVPDADKEIMALSALTNRDACVVQQKNLAGFSTKETYSAEGSILLATYKPNDLVYKTEANAEQFAVFSEIFYPKGWNAYLDGKIVPHTCVNYLLRGMPIPAGKHTLEFKFEPKSYAIGNSIATFGSLLLLLSIAVSTFFMFWKKKA